MPLPVKKFLVSLCLAVAATFVCPAAWCQVRTGSGPGLTLEISLSRTKVYQGEAVAVDVTLKTAAVKVRNVGFPRIDGAPIDFAVAASPVADTAQEGSIYRFIGEWLPAGPGSVKLGPAHLECEVIDPAAGGAAFFGSAVPRRIKLESRPATVVVMALPDAGRPVSFSGAIGSFSMSVVSRPAEVAINDPVSVLSTIHGIGDLTGADCPNIFAPGLRTYPPSMKRKPDTLECEQVIIPADEGVPPVIEWSHFDPGRGAYLTDRRELPLHVSSQKGPIAASSAYPEGQSNSLFFFWLAGLSIFAAVARLLWRATQRRVSGRQPFDNRAPDHWQTELEQLERALAEEDAERFYTLLRGHLQLLVGSVTGAAPATVTFAPPGVPDETPITRLFAQCDRVRYGRFMPETANMQADLDLLRSFNQVFDHIE